VVDEIEWKRKARAALGRAVELAEGQSGLARICGGKVKQAHVWKWINGSGLLPAQYARLVEHALDGKVTRYELRPDVFGAEEKRAA
jgi:DNA-binding transcriptional regulator YdaS (Cro superfamily)